jgi:hypothetical protein
MSEKKKSPRTLGLFFSGLLVVVSAINALTLLTSEKQGSDLGMGFVVMFALCLFWFRSCYVGRKEYFSEEKRKKREQVQKSKVEREVMTTAKSDHIECSYLGGSGYSLAQNEKFFLALTDDCLKFTKISDGSVFDIAFTQVHEVEVSGPGTVTTNAGVSGGGFGLEGFLKGAVAATVINAATTKSSTNTFVRILSAQGEIYLHTSTKEPGALKIIFSPLVVHIANRGRKTDSNTQANVAQEVEKLHKLKQDGLLDEAEFKAAKNKLLGL